MSDPGVRARLGLLRDALLIISCGVIAGLAFNLAQRQGRPPRGLPWIAATSQLPGVDSLAPPNPARAVAKPPHEDLARPPEPSATRRSAPPTRAAPPAPSTETREVAAADDLPAIPDVDHPLAVRLSLVSRFVEAGAALVVDARGATEFAAGHIPEAVNVPYEEATHDPTPLAALHPAGRPIIVYCGGGGCEASRMLAQMMVRDFGMRRVLVYEGGYPEWVGARPPVSRGGS